MRTSGIILTGAAISAALFLPRILGAANVGRNMVTRFRGVRFGKVVGAFPSYRLQMQLDIEATNPTGSSARIDFIDLQLKTPQGAPFADITRAGANYMIPARSTTMLTVPFELGLTNTLISVIFPAALSLIQNKGTGTAVTEAIKNALPSGLNMAGNIRVNSIRVPVNQQIAIIKK